MTVGPCIIKPVGRKRNSFCRKTCWIEQQIVVWNKMGPIHIGIFRYIVVWSLVRQNTIICKWCHLVAKFVTYACGAIWWPNLQLMQVALSWWPNLQLMQVAPSGDHICSWCKWHPLVAKFVTDVSVAILLPSSIQVTESISGSVVPLAMFL